MCVCVCFEQSKLMGCMQCQCYLLRSTFTGIGWWVVATGNLAPLPTQPHKFRSSATSLVPQHLRWRGGKTSACSSFRWGGSTIFNPLRTKVLGNWNILKCVIKACFQRSFWRIDYHKRKVARHHLTSIPFISKPILSILQYWILKKII